MINLHSNEYSQEFHCYPFAVKLDRCAGSCNTLNEVLNRIVFKMITGKNELMNCKCKFYGQKCNSDQWWSSSKYRCDCKKRHVCEKDYIWNPSTCRYENGKCLASTIDDSTITCDKIVESYDEQKNFNEKKATCETQISIFHLYFCSLPLHY